MTVTITITQREAADGSVTSVECEVEDEFGQPIEVGYALLVGILELAKDQVLKRRWEDEETEEPGG